MSEKFSYCKIHDTYPADGEPCWHCVTQFKEEDQEGTPLEKAAKKAARTGNRTDLHEYLKLRRNLI